jgi:hypothetical protein
MEETDPVSSMPKIVPPVTPFTVKEREINGFTGSGMV